MKSFQLLTGSILFIITLIAAIPASGNVQFPAYKEIQPNIIFWKKVYGSYTSQQGILHDRNNLNIIYKVIELVNRETQGAEIINRKLINLAKKRTKNILLLLGKGKKPVTYEERQIAALFPANNHTRLLKASEDVRLQIGQKDRFRKGVITSGKYIRTLKKIFKRYNLPTDLAYLPHVESSFNPQAKSKAGAAGLWQFTQGTGREYMTINSLLDERLDPFRSTHAAAKLLEINYAQLNSWPLAITAYNYGRSGMQRAVDEHQDYVSIFLKYRKGYFKFASRNFYSELLAAIEVAKKLEKNKILFRAEQPTTLTLTMQGYASSKQLRYFFDLSKEEFACLNPALKSPVLNDDKLIPKGYKLRLPATRHTSYKITQLKKSMFTEKQRPDRYYIVKHGDTVGSIANKYKTTIKKLTQLNDLDNYAAIKAGQKLIISHLNKHLVVLQGVSKSKP